MQRRKFLGGLTMLGVGAVASVTVIESADAKRYHGETEIVKYSVKGFTCTTCAVGLETLLMRQSGVVSVKADYPSAIAVVEFAPELIKEQKLRDTIQEMGFSAQQI